MRTSCKYVPRSFSRDNNFCEHYGIASSIRFRITVGNMYKYIITLHIQYGIAAILIWTMNFATPGRENRSYQALTFTCFNHSSLYTITQKIGSSK